MEEGTSNEDHTPLDELMSDNEVILYEITNEPAGSGTNKRRRNPPKRKEAETIPNERFF